MVIDYTYSYMSEQGEKTIFFKTTDDLEKDMMTVYGIDFKKLFKGFSPKLAASLPVGSHKISFSVDYEAGSFVIKFFPISSNP